MKKLVFRSLLLAAAALSAAELKQPAFQMPEADLLAVLKENPLNDKVTACQELRHKGTSRAVPALAAQLTDASEAPLFQAACDALQGIPGPEATDALRKALAAVKAPPRRSGVEAALRLRAQPVPPDYPGAVQALLAPSPKTPLQAGDLAVVPALLEQALGAGAAAQLARRRLVGFPNDGIVQKMLDLAAGPDARKAKLACSILGDRRARRCLPQLCSLARTTKDAGVRSEIFKSFATLCEPGDLPLLLNLLREMPAEDRLAGSIIRLASRAFAAAPVEIRILRAEYGYFGKDEVKDERGNVVKNPVADVQDMVSALVQAGSRSIMASNRLAGHGGFARDPAPRRPKELHLSYQIDAGPTRTLVVKENAEVELSGVSLPETVARPLVDACVGAQGDFRAALERILGTLEKRGRVPGAEAAHFRPIFNGRDLSGWSQEGGFFSVKDGVIIGASTTSHPCKPNHHLVYTAEQLADFELRAEFKLSRQANSGIQVRCAAQFLGDNGYQADMNGGGNYVGYLYHPRQHLVGERGADVSFDASGKKTVSRFTDGKALQGLYRAEDWNDIRICVKGHAITVWINGVRTTSVDDPRPDFLPPRGHIALQLHQGPEMTVQFRNLRIRK